MSESFSFLHMTNLNYIEKLHGQFCSDESVLDDQWRSFFHGMELGAEVVGSKETSSSLQPLIDAYRRYGHLLADSNPIAEVPDTCDELNIENFNLQESSYHFPLLNDEETPVSTIIDHLKSIYCNKIGFEYMHIDSKELIDFIKDQIEPNLEIKFSNEEKQAIIDSLIKAEKFESFIHRKYPGQKRFSLEGGETLIPMMNALIEACASTPIEEVIVGMAHRGRLSILANIFGKSYASMFQEFEAGYIPPIEKGSGDVKYHKGYQSKRNFEGGKEIFLDLIANPSHLEAVNPIVEGKALARSWLKKKDHSSLPILIHGDAAVAGQGIVYETLQLAAINGYATGGTVHLIINNQVGFTASPKQARSTRYATDIAKAFNIPIFHVNAEDPESCVWVTKLALLIREKFHIDVFIELNSYRKYGHNEGDEPSFTQPVLYDLIRKKKKIHELYIEKLLLESAFTKDFLDNMQTQFDQLLETEQQKIKNGGKEQIQIDSTPTVEEKKAIPSQVLSKEDLILQTKAFCSFPENFTPHPKIKRIFDERLEVLDKDPNEKAIDFGMAEYLAYSSLLTKGVPIRISGQDSRRGTFSHRHGAITDQQSGKRYYPLSNLSKDQASFDVFNSPLSEYSVLGFEFGYSIGDPSALVIWEAQYGDFANGAQIIIDQFIASSSTKWDMATSLTLFLPHGYEGQGPEHSSARLERFLQLAADDNIRICVPSTPAQLFHLIRLQGLHEDKKPLIVFMPKANLRLKESTFDELVNGFFQAVIEDENSDKKKIQRILFCSGKVAFDLLSQKQERAAEHIAIIKLEQIYPFPKEELQAILQSYPSVKECFWVQEEHQNMGAYTKVFPEFREVLDDKIQLRYCGRKESASPAAGSSALHKQQLQEFIERAFS